MKIGIFDPNLEEFGHYIYFNKHIAKLLDSKDNKLVFLDIAGIFHKNYSQNLRLEESTFQFVNVSDVPCPSDRENNHIYDDVTHLSQYKMYMSDRSWYKEVFKKISALNLDITLITSHGRAPMFTVVPNFKFGIILHTSRILKVYGKHWLQTFLRRISRKFNKKFLDKSSIIFTLELYLVKELQREGLNNVFYVPYKCFNSAMDKNFPSDYGLKENEFTLLTIGVIYKGKGLDSVLNIYDKYNLDTPYSIVGLSSGEYGNLIDKKVQELQTRNLPVKRIPMYLSDEEYRNFISKADFVLLPYSVTRYDQTSGVMYDALEQNTPIIAPAIEPFKSYVENYDIGLLYNPEDDLSFVNTVKKARHLGKSYFWGNIERFKKQFTYSIWKEKIFDILTKIEENNGR